MMSVAITAVSMISVPVSVMPASWSLTHPAITISPEAELTPTLIVALAPVFVAAVPSGVPPTSTPLNDATMMARSSTFPP